jgi:hypothetical protein
MLAVVVNILPEGNNQQKPRSSDQCFELDISSLQNYEQSFDNIDPDIRKSNAILWNKKTKHYGAKYSTDFQRISCTSGLSIMLRDNDLKRSAQFERDLLKAYMKAIYLTCGKSEKQRIPCVYCTDISISPERPSEPGIILNSTDLKDCQRLNAENARFR